MEATTNNQPRNMLVMKASAGSGKTYNLALQYIKHLLFTTDVNGRLVPRRGDGDERILNAHRLLLAITFTNKATDQMKARIVDELYNLARDGMKSKYLQGFMNESGLPEGRVRRLARMALNELMLDYSNFNVSTIDSFFQSILRNFARELDRDFNYDIQLEAKYAIRLAIHNFLLSLGQKDQPTDVDEWVRDYQQHQLRGDVETKNWRFFEDGGNFLSFAKEIDSELFRSRMNKVREYLGHVDENGNFKSDFRKIREFKKYLAEIIDECKQEKNLISGEIVPILQPLAGDLYGGRIFDSIVNKGVEPDEKLPELSSDKIINQFKPNNKPDDGTLDQLTQLVDKYQQCHLKGTLMEYIRDKLGLLGMLGMIDVYLERFRHETNSILIGDTNELIGTVLESGSAFVYERVGTLIAHFMIDEFQDTSAKQYENFHGLLKESLANGNFNMLIGDAKQSIYRFRNADPTVFREKVNWDFRDDIYEPPVKPGSPSSVNFRSSRHIIEFNNSLFAFVTDQYAACQPVVATFGDATQGMPPTIDEDKVPGFVRVVTDNYQLVVNPDQPIEKPSAGKKEKGKKEEKKKVSVLDVLPQYLLQIHERFDWGRIGILVNTRKEGNKIVECILDHNRKSPDQHISIISGESLLLSNSPIVRRIISMLRFIDISQYSADSDDRVDPDEVPNDQLARRLAKKRLSDQRMYSALNEFIKHLGTEGEASAEANGDLLEKCLDETSIAGGTASGAQSQDDRFMQLLESLLPNGNELTTLVSIVETIIAYFRSSDVMSQEVNHEAAFLLAFQDTVMKFASMRNGGTLREFLKFWDEKKDTLAVNTRASSDAINIMTIHKAKGLEFECVVIPFAAWQINENSQETHYWMPGEAFVDTLQPTPPCDETIVPPLLNVGKKVITSMRDNGMLKDKALEFVDDQRTAVLIDNLNKTYVAMTRPCTELHLFTQNGSTKTNDMDQLLKGFSEAEGSIMRALTDVQDNATGWFEYGELSSRELIDSKREQQVLTALQVPLTQYLVSDIPEDLKVRVEHASSASIDAGIRLHSLMSQIRDVHDVDRVIKQGIKHGVITQDSEDPCGIDNVMKHVCGPIMDSASRVAAWFDPANKVYSERTITTASNSLWDDGGIQNLRPDRIILRPDGNMVVIDYKSGQRDDKGYLRKLNLYMEKLRAIFSGTPVHGRLWYVTHDLILDEKGRPLE